MTPEAKIPHSKPNLEHGDWELTRRLLVTIGDPEEGTERELWFEAEERSNGANIPRLAWFFVGPPMTPEMERSVWGHDLLYQHATKLGVTKAEADLYFRRTMLEDGAEKPRLKYWSVRLLGWWAWWKSRRAEA